MDFPPMYERLQERTWTTKEGITLKPEQMTTSHIMNTMNMIKRSIPSMIAYQQQLYLLCTPPDGDMALYAFEQEMGYLFDMDEQRFFRDYVKTSPLWKAFEKVLKDREGITSGR